MRLSAVLLVVALTLYGQRPTGEIDLTVKDPSGAPMQASGKLVSLAPGVNRSFQTDAQGAAALGTLPYGRYRLEISKNGFDTHSELIDVQSPAPITRNVAMVLGTLASQVDVVATTPLVGIDLPLDEVPAPVQTATQNDVERSGALDLSDFMNRRLNGVYVNEMQGNPFQPDVNYRGYTASPLLGTPQGISVYIDGVRQNQPFGDVVSWDLIPRNAISEMTLMPGSNPMFGLNTLGGALSIQTKDGVTSPGLDGQLTYGSSGRKALQAEEGGGQPTGFNWFLSANVFHESGWRFDSPSDIRQGFGRFGWRTAKTDLAFTGTYAYNTLTGNGLQDYRLLALNYSSVYTIPDTTANRSPSFNFSARHSFSETLTFSGNTWYRNIRTEGVNGNANTNSFTDSDPDYDAITIYSKEVQNDFGLSGQMTWVTKPLGHRNQFTAGAVFDRGSVTFTQNTQYGNLNPDRSITGVPLYTSPVDLHGTTPNGGVFATDTLLLGKGWTVTASGRYNRTYIHNSDLINPGGGPGSLDGDYVYQRFNPSIGVNYSPIAAVNLYASYSQGSRAPTSIELGCADPENPCNLPNALASDPPLSQVVTSTWETGLRGKLAQIHLNWDLGAFRSANRNDILFVASQQTGSGYFQNFAKTLREGVQVSLNGHLKRLNAGLDYTFLSATYQSTETLDGTANNTSDLALEGFPGIGGVITVHPGNRIPLIPKQTGKAFADFQATSKLNFDLGLVATSSSYARGNENNAYQPDGKYYLGPGVSPGYAVVDVEAHYDLTRRLQLGVQIDNILNRHYSTAAQLANTPFTNQGTLIFQPFPAYTTGPEAGNYPVQSATFFSPGAPRRAWVELRIKF